MSAEFRSVTGRAHQFVPIAQNTERARPKRQVVGESPAGDAISEWSDGVMDYWITGFLNTGKQAARINPTLHQSNNPFLPSLWCSPVNMPASHAGDHRSEAGQGHQFFRRVVRGEQQTHLTQNQAALDVQVVSRR